MGRFTLRKMVRTLTALDRRAPVYDIPVVEKPAIPGRHLTEEEFDVAQSQGLLSMEWTHHPTFIRMIVEYYDDWPLLKAIFRVNTAENLLVVIVREALTEQERHDRRGKVKSITHRFPQHNLKDAVKAAMTMTKQGMPVSLEMVNRNGKLVPRKKIADYQPGMWLVPFVPFNQFFVEHFNLVQVKPDLEDRVKARFS